MQSSACSSQPAKPRRFDGSRRATNYGGPKSRIVQKEDKNMNTTTSSSPRRLTKAPVATPRTRPMVQPRVALSQSRFGAQKQSSVPFKSAKPKPKSLRTVVTTKKISPPLPPAPSVLPLDPNCNEPSLPCLCCDGRSPQDNNSMFNHNHNNNNTISLRHQLQLPPPPPVATPQRKEGTGAKDQVWSPSQPKPEPPSQSSINEDMLEKADLDDKKDAKSEEEDDESSSGDIDIDDEDDDDGDRDDEDDDDTLVPSCCDCPPSLLEFSLSSSTSSSSTSISSCSDLESDCADQYTPQHQDPLSVSIKDSSPQCQPPARSLPSLPIGRSPFTLTSHTPISSPDEGYPSALDTPSPDYLGVKDDPEVTKLGLLDFLESVGEFGKMERFSQVIQVARWDLEGEQNWDVLRDRLDHLDRLEKVNREIKLSYIARLHEKGFNLGDLEEQDLSDVMDEMGNIDVGWKLYRSSGAFMGESQEFSDAGVDLTAPSDCDDPLAPDSLTPSPAEPPPRPPKPPARHASVNSDLHTYINISRETTSMAVSTSPTLSTFSPNSSSPTFTTFRCEKPLPLSPPSIPPLPVSKPVPYLTLYTTSAPSVPTPTPPIPPPRRRHLARKEAQRLAALQAEQEKTPLSLPPPTTRPPPLPPPPVISSSLPPPGIPPPPPPALPPPPSFHALDVEIRKLLMLAGLTQAELLKLSPELGDCVGMLDEEDGKSSLPEEDKESDPELMEKGCGSRGKSAADGRADIPREGKTEEAKESQRTTSFSEMARRRKKSSILTSDTYYSTTVSHTQDTKAKNMGFDSCHYPGEVLDSPPPPPPPRPLPPVPPSVPPLRVSTLLANSSRPERFDWLIAFTPEADIPLQSIQLRKSHMETTKKTSPVPKVTSFKELRYRNKSAAPTTKVITDPDPDPTVITPDPDILYNLKWRREKEGSGGSQWEYTSQAQALFMQPPPALTSMAALKEMLQRADEESGRAAKVGCSQSDSSLWTTGREWEREDVVKEDKKRWEEEEAEVRGQADGGRTLESRTTVSSPSLSLIQPSQPYFLHAIPTSYPQDHFHINSRPHAHVGQESSEAQDDPLRAHADAVFSYQSGVYLGSLDRGNELKYNKPKQRSSSWRKDDTLGSQSNIDSLYCSDEQSIADNRAAVATECTTPYKNIDVMMTHQCDQKKERDSYANRTRTSKELPPLPTYYLHRSKHCPLHGGSPPRLSPVGALSPPQRSGALPLGALGSGLTSPLFPRSHTLPALVAPPYYPHLYPSIPLCAPPLPPKLYQASQQPRVATVRSVSFAGAVQRGDASWMGEDVPHPMRGHRLSSLHLLEKRALVSAVSVAVEAVLAQFSSSRTVVQKALSGDSTVNPSLGRLVLQCLCPALHSLLTDGLKPHQSDLIAGRRPNSAWSLVLASTKPGPKTQALFNLQLRVGELHHLKQSKHRFNAFVLGLLNSKQLDFWVSHLQSSSDILDTYYRPSSFMRLSLSACQPLFDELLLVLQPLSLLTFNLDLLFQHHRLEPHIPAPQVRSPPSQDAGQSNRPEIRGGKYMESLSGVDFSDPGNQETEKGQLTPGNVAWSLTLGHTSPQLRWIQEKRIGELPPPNLDEDSLAQQAGQVIQQGWGAVMRWGERLSQNLAELNLAAGKTEEAKNIQQAQTGNDLAPVNSVAQVPWSLGRLFGFNTSKSPNSPAGHAPPSRRPSQWLAPGVTALTRMVSSSSAPVLRKTPEPMERNHTVSEITPDAPQMTEKTHRSVRTLCDHTGSGSELSFRKDEELIVLAGVDQDWIRCRQGDREGLVPIGYTSLIM
ncbi:uncharacterized protein rusc1 isoform X1 [Corythoichthys intestinalis]|uniref:uncharacterized protein rusc1 isoform X1 n=1 Tax=Corythoichthys intestinalis TaxID=161448 RepID=UPI0025A51628|nr:uncharacterized protein rusc1 isoform X1 [Corythoichthys intestinalis]